MPDELVSSPQRSTRAERETLQPQAPFTGEAKGSTPLERNEEHTLVLYARAARGVSTFPNDYWQRWFNKKTGPPSMLGGQNIIRRHLRRPPRKGAQALLLPGRRSSLRHASLLDE